MSHELKSKEHYARQQQELYEELFVKEASVLGGAIAGGLLGAGVGYSRSDKKNKMRNALLGAGAGGVLGAGAGALMRGASGGAGGGGGGGGSKATSKTTAKSSTPTVSTSKSTSTPTSATERVKKSVDKANENIKAKTTPTDTKPKTDTKTWTEQRQSALDKMDPVRKAPSTTTKAPAQDVQRPPIPTKKSEPASQRTKESVERVTAKAPSNNDPILMKGRTGDGKPYDQSKFPSRSDFDSEAAYNTARARHNAFKKQRVEDLQTQGGVTQQMKDNVKTRSEAMDPNEARQSLERMAQKSKPKQTPPTPKRTYKKADNYSGVEGVDLKTKVYMKDGSVYDPKMPVYKQDFGGKTLDYDAAVAQQKMYTAKHGSGRDPHEWF